MLKGGNAPPPTPTPTPTPQNPLPTHITQGQVITHSPSGLQHWWRPVQRPVILCEDGVQTGKAVLTGGEGRGEGEGLVVQVRERCWVLVSMRGVGVKQLSVGPRMEERREGCKGGRMQ